MVYGLWSIYKDHSLSHHHYIERITRSISGSFRSLLLNDECVDLYSVASIIMSNGDEKFSCSSIYVCTYIMLYAPLVIRIGFLAENGDYLYRTQIFDPKSSTKALWKLALNVTLFNLTLRPKSRETEGDKEVLIWWPRGIVQGCLHRACTKNLMSRMETKVPAARWPAATGLLQVSIMSTHSYII